jgi:hypothetical protein
MARNRGLNDERNCERLGAGEALAQLPAPNPSVTWGVRGFRQLIFELAHGHWYKRLGSS